MGDWVVVLEFEAGEDRLEFERVCSLVERLAPWAPVGIYHPDRYALQLHVRAFAAFDAIRIATTQHEEATRALGVSDSFLRAEVLTLGEFEASWHDYATPSGEAVRRSQVGGLVPSEVYAATSALIGASTADAVTEILVRFVRAVGGSVQVGPPPDAPGFLSLDLSLSPAHPLHALADAVSVTGLVLEEWLPLLIEDARRTLAPVDRR